MVAEIIIFAVVLPLVKAVIIMRLGICGCRDHLICYGLTTSKGCYHRASWDMGLQGSLNGMCLL